MKISGTHELIDITKTVHRVLDRLDLIVHVAIARGAGVGFEQRDKLWAAMNLHCSSLPPRLERVGMAKAFSRSRAEVC
jgi:hypothetical protein